jgi:two-component system chemotaxis response regulator CheY
MLVDDSAVLRRSMRNALGHLNVPADEICEAANGLEALEHVGAQSIRLILLDLTMPVMDGEEFLRALQGLNKQPQIPVILVTTEQNRARLARLSELGVAGYLNKPFAPEDLVTLLAEELV